MDLGIKGRMALVCASSAGLGKACALSLAREGCAVTINGRDAARLEQAAGEILARTGARVKFVAADLSTSDGQAALVEACPRVDILVNNNGGPPPGRLEDWGRAEFLAALEANMLSAILLTKAFLVGMRSRKFGRIVNITSARVKSPTPAMALSSSARAGLTAFAKAISLEVAVDNVTINNLLPERVDTHRQDEMVDRMRKAEGVSEEEAKRRIVQTIAARRLGDPSEFGDACAFLCSAQAGYISGQNLQLDGGSYRGLI
ncbi:MAG TPA: SDR family oxidoreductase [Usitatibacter sp.]|nr:SDR family oxidoreductase [Usitatibacter sp.]